MKLIDDERLLDKFGQQFNLHRVLVANAKIFDFAAVVQDVEGFGNFFWLYQCVRAMQQHNVEIIRSQPFKTAFDRFQNVFFGKIEGAFANPDLGLEDHGIAQARCHIQRFGKFLFRFAAAIHIGMVEKVDLLVQSGVDQRCNVLIGHCSNAHTTKRYFGRIKVAMCNFDLIHLIPFILKSVLNDLNANSNAQLLHIPSIDRGEMPEQNIMRGIQNRNAFLPIICAVAFRRSQGVRARLKNASAPSN